MNEVKAPKAKIDYTTISLGIPNDSVERTTTQVLDMFAKVLPKTYKDTCRDAICSRGRTERISQFGITVAKQYGDGSRYFAYSVQLSGQYWEAIRRDKQRVLDILQRFQSWRLSRLDLCLDVSVPIEEWNEYNKTAFNSGSFIVGKNDAITVSQGSRRSQFYTRIYNKTASDSRHYPAPEGEVQIRYELEIHRVQGEKVMSRAFLDKGFANNLLLQRIRKTAANDTTGFISRHFDNDSTISKIKTVERIEGDFAKTVKYVLKTYKPYILAGLKSGNFAEDLEIVGDTDAKINKILAVLNLKKESEEKKDGKKQQQPLGD